MNEKIQTRLEVMQVWADLANHAERKIKDAQDEIEAQTECLNQEQNKPEDERSKWRIESYKDEIAAKQREIEAVNQVQAQILKLMG